MKGCVMFSYRIKFSKYGTMSYKDRSFSNSVLNLIFLDKMLLFESLDSVDLAITFFPA